MKWMFFVGILAVVFGVPWLGRKLRDASMQYPGIADVEDIEDCIYRWRVFGKKKNQCKIFCLVKTKHGGSLGEKTALQWANMQYPDIDWEFAVKVE